MRMVEGAGGTWRQFAQESSVHGLKYSVGRRRIDRWVWTLLPLACVGVAGMLVMLLVWRYLDNPTRTTYRSQFEPVADMHFTAVSVCAPRRLTKYGIQNLMQALSMPNNVSATEVRAALPQLLGFVHSLTVLPSSLAVLDLVLRHNDMEPDTVMGLLSPNCNDLLVHCRWKGKDESCKRLFTRSKTHLGYCCSFNYNSDNPESQWLSNQFMGPNMGLSFILDTYYEEYEKQVFHKLDSFQILLHRSDSYAGRFSDTMFMSLHSEVMMGIVPLRLGTGPQAMALSSEARRCLLQNEKPLKYSPEYSKDNCLLECEISESVKRCGCQPFMYPAKEGDRVCRASSIPCLILHFQALLKVGWEVECSCPEQCNQNTTSLEVHSTKLNGYQFNPDPFYQQLTVNQTLVHVFQDRQIATEIHRKIFVYWVDLLSSFGGMFNLFLGCSFISILEAIYFLCVKFPRNYIKNINIKEKKNIIARKIVVEAKD